jgi:hypothetical protein
MPLDARLSRREADTLIGYVTHELGHALFTDFACYDASVTLGLHNLVNGLEDIRCEAKLCAHGGSIGNARELLEILTEYTTLKALGNGWSHLNPAALPFTLYQVGAIEILGYNVPSMPALVFPEPLAGIIRETMARVRQAKNTSDVLAIAQWLMTALPAMPPMPSNPAPCLTRAKTLPAGCPSRRRTRSPHFPEGGRHGAGRRRRHDRRCRFRNGRRQGERRRRQGERRRRRRHAPQARKTRAKNPLRSPPRAFRRPLAMLPPRKAKSPPATTLARLRKARAETTNGTRPMQRRKTRK